MEELTDPRKDPKYKELYEGGGSQWVKLISDVWGQYQKQKQLDLVSEEQAAQLEEKKAARASRTALTEALKTATPDQYQDLLRKSYMETGNAEGLMGLEAKEEAKEKTAAASEQQFISTVEKMAQINPGMAAAMWNSSPLAKKHGPTTEDMFTKKPEVKAGAGMLYHVDNAGRIVIDYRAPEKQKGEKTYAPQWRQYVDDSGEMHVLNMRDDEDRSQIEELDLKPYSVGGSGNTMAQFQEMMSQINGGATAAPAPKKKRMVLVPKGIEQ